MSPLRFIFAAGLLVAAAALPACSPGGAEPVDAAGAAGTTGAAGTSSAAGTSGSAGTSGGAAGTTGIAGTTGPAGTSGMAGTTGAAGTTGTAGTIGAAGAAGAAGGTTGTAGGVGAAGRGGTSGEAGRGGTSGGAGRGGAGGGAGRGGSSPDGGTTGTGGATYMPCPTTAGTACAVLPLGDSITEGYLPSGANGGYRVELFRQAVTANKNITFVGSQMNGPTTVQNQNFPRRHEGRGGYTIAGGGSGALAGSVTDNALTMHPHIVLLMIGTNDINGNINVSTAPTRLGQLIDEITSMAPAALVVVASIIPIVNDGTNPRIPNYNSAIPGLVNTRAAAGKHVVFLDNYAAIIKDANWKTSLMVDNLHPNEAGYAVLGRSFYAAIAPVLP